MDDHEQSTVFQGKHEDLCKVATQAEEALGEVCTSYSSTIITTTTIITIATTTTIIIIIIIIIKMVETVEELMIAVLGGSAEIVGWPQKVVLCAAEVSISDFFSSLSSEGFNVSLTFAPQKIEGFPKSHFLPQKVTDAQFKLQVEPFPEECGEPIPWPFYWVG